MKRAELIQQAYADGTHGTLGVQMARFDLEEPCGLNLWSIGRACLTTGTLTITSEGQKKNAPSFIGYGTLELELELRLQL